jgi:hypothetical protein
MRKVEFLTIYPTFEQLDIVRQTLPSVIEETRRNNAALIVHDSSVRGRDEKWEYLKGLNRDKDFFLILSDNLSMGQARNLCLFTGLEIFCPDYVCMIEDDLGFKEGLISAMVKAMKTYYGTVSPNGLRYGLFTGCKDHHVNLVTLEDGNACPHPESSPGSLGGANSCFRAAPTSHWQNVLKGYDTDEYLISTYQTRHLNFRNYHQGFTAMIVADGKMTFHVECAGRGTSSNDALRLWDETYTASDARSRYIGKPTPATNPATPPPSQAAAQPKKSWLGRLSK